MAGAYVIFSGNDTNNYGNLWVTDGTAAGTSELLVTGASYGENPSNLTVFGSEVLFTGNDDSDPFAANLWVTDGTADGTSEIPVTGAASYGLSPEYFTVLGSEVLFDGTSANREQNLWVTDGTAAGTSEISVAGAFSFGLLPQNPGSGAEGGSSFAVLGSEALFSGHEASGGEDLWVTNGTADGTSEITFNDITPFDITVFGSEALFQAQGGLWITDGTAAGTSEFGPGYDASSIAVLGSEALFSAALTSGQYEGSFALFATNGTYAGTGEIFGIPSSGAAPLGLHPTNLTVFGSEVLFNGVDSSGYQDLWVTDGTTAGTSEISVAGASTTGLNPTDFTVFGSEVLFNGFDSNNQDGLWVTNGTAAGTSEISVAGASPYGLDPQYITVVPCYCRGTLIRTQRGQERVEKLKIGDKVVTASGMARPIKWIGRRGYGGRFILGRKDILPVCIKAGALDDNVPRRDLWISPHHAMYLEGALIEAKDLVNGVSIVQAERVETVEYFHIELESHDVILAEGAPSETFIDDDSRFMFHNAHEYAALHRDEVAPAAAAYCAPRLEDGYEVERARRRIALRAGLQAKAAEPPIGALRGYIDVISPRRIAGWAQNLDHPEAPVCLDIYAGGQPIAQVLANRYRDDLEQAGLGSGRHSFEFTPPARLIFIPGTVEVRRALDGSALKRAKRVA
jgi:ELWxxDGT repeat protein